MTTAFLGDFNQPPDKPERLFEPKQTPNACISADCGPARLAPTQHNLAGKAYFQKMGGSNSAANACWADL
jgi:hypothetical protein